MPLLIVCPQTRKNTDDKFVSILFPSTRFGGHDLGHSATFAILVYTALLGYKG